MIGRRWVVLAIGVMTQAATASFVYGIALLLPALRPPNTSAWSARAWW